MTETCDRCWRHKANAADYDHASECSVEDCAYGEDLCWGCTEDDEPAYLHDEIRAIRTRVAELETRNQTLEETLDAVQSEHEAQITVREHAATIERLRGAGREMLLSADSSWEGSGLGHDWDESCEAMRRALATDTPEDE